jgi:hypothetical protein
LVYKPEDKWKINVDKDPGLSRYNGVSVGFRGIGRLLCKGCPRRVKQVEK